MYLTLILYMYLLNTRLATTAMKQLPPDVIAAAQNNALWSREEENKLATVPSVRRILYSRTAQAQSDVSVAAECASNDCCQLVINHNYTTTIIECGRPIIEIDD